MDTINSSKFFPSQKFYHIHRISLKLIDFLIPKHDRSSSTIPLSKHIFDVCQLQNQHTAFVYARGYTRRFSRVSAVHQTVHERASYIGRTRGNGQKITQSAAFPCAQPRTCALNAAVSVENTMIYGVRILRITR